LAACQQYEALKQWPEVRPLKMLLQPEQFELQNMRNDESQTQSF
jgi:hypothetical protein